MQPALGTNSAGERLCLGETLGYLQPGNASKEPLPFSHQRTQLSRPTRHDLPPAPLKGQIQTFSLRRQKSRKPQSICPPCEGQHQSAGRWGEGSGSRTTRGSGKPCWKGNFLETESNQLHHIDLGRNHHVRQGHLPQEPHSADEEANLPKTQAADLEGKTLTYCV